MIERTPTQPGQHTQPFRCVHCAYDLSAVRTHNSDNLCPECGLTTDPYNPRAHIVRNQSPLLAGLKALAAAIPAGIAMALALFSHIAIIVFGFALFYIPLLVCDVTMKRSLQRQRKALGLALGTGVAFGLLLGSLLLVAAGAYW